MKEEGLMLRGELYTLQHTRPRCFE